MGAGGEWLGCEEEKGEKYETAAAAVAVSVPQDQVEDEEWWRVWNRSKTV